MSKSLSAKDLFPSLTSQVIEVELPALGGSVWVRPLTVEDFNTVTTLEDEQSRTQMIVRSVCDAEGNPLFSLDQADQIRNMDLRTFMTLVRVINDVSGLSEPETEEEIKNGSGTEQSERSTV